MLTKSLRRAGRRGYTDRGSDVSIGAHPWLLTRGASRERDAT